MYLQRVLARLRTMERREPRASRSGAWQPRRLAGWQRWELARVASQARAAGDRAVKMHGVVIFFRHPEGTQQGCGQQRTSAVVDDAPTASSAKPAQLSKRKQRSSMRLADFRRRMELRSAQAGDAASRAGAAAAVEAAARRWLARRHVARLRAAVPPPLESGAVAPSAAKGKRRVDFSAPVPPSKKAWVVTGIGAGWLRELARGEREAREAGAVAAAKAEAAAAEEAAAEEEAVAAAAVAAAVRGGGPEAEGELRGGDVAREGGGGVARQRR